jgi:protein TonB
MAGERTVRRSTNGAARPRLSGLSAGAAIAGQGGAAGVFEDPMSRVLGMDASVTGVAAWFRFGSGGTILMVALMALVSVVAWVHRSEAQVAEAPSEVDIMREEAPPPPPPPPQEEPEHKAEPAPPPKAMPHEAPPPPPPAPAQAGKVLTAEPDPNEPVDLTGNTIVTGNADAYAGGSTTANGTSATAVRGLASPKGVVGGTGAPTAAPAPVGPDRSHAAVLGGGKEWQCPFPPEADAAQVDEAQVMLEVQIRPDGSAGSVTVLKDPGYSFGREARNCALRQHHTAATDHDGNPIASTIKVKVKFSR